jgi:hypothetical protein
MNSGCACRRPGHRRQGAQAQPLRCAGTRFAHATGAVSRAGADQRPGLDGADLPGSGREHRSSRRPLHRHQEHLPAEGVESGHRAGAEHHSPGLPRSGLHQVGVADVLNRRAGAEVPVGQQGVARVASIRAGHRLGPRRRDGVVALGAALRRQQEVRSVAPVEMRRLDPGAALGAVPQDVARSDQGQPNEVELTQPQFSRAGDRRLGGIPASGEPAAAVGVEEEGRIDTLGVEHHRVGPRSGRVAGGGQQGPRALPGAGDRRDQVEQALVVTDGRRPDAVGDLEPGEIDDPRPVEDVADRFPVDQISAVEDGNAGQKSERGHYEVVIVADPAYRRVGVEARNDRVREFRHGFPLCCADTGRA